MTMPGLRQPFRQPRQANRHATWTPPNILLRGTPGCHGKKCQDEGRIARRYTLRERKCGGFASILAMGRPFAPSLLRQN
jgi:hypothetical protein